MPGLSPPPWWLAAGAAAALCDAWFLAMAVQFAAARCPL